MSDITMPRGDTRAWTVTCSRSGAPINITGASIVMTGRLRLNDVDKVFSRSGTVTDALNGVATVTMLPVDTTSLPPEDTTLVYDVELTEAGGAVSTVVSGSLVVTCDVTF